MTTSRRAEDLEALAAQLGRDSIRATTAAGSGHPTSSLSARHLMAVMLSDHLRFDLRAPHDPRNDRFVLSKGHAAPLLYAALRAVGAIDDETLLSLRKLGSPLEGHPSPVHGLPLVEVATGSLGQGLSIGLGMSLAMRLDELDARTWVLLGDSEMTEGSIWEAMATAAHHEVTNLVAILDMNRLGQSGPTMLGWDAAAYAARARSFGWRTIEINGHDVRAIDGAYRVAEDGEGPTLVIAKTKKGQGVSFLEDALGWHGKVLDEAAAARALEELVGPEVPRIEMALPTTTEPTSRPKRKPLTLPRYQDAIATRDAFGATLAALAAWPEVVVLDGEVGDSTRTMVFGRRAPERFFQMYIGEQGMVGAAVGLAVREKIAFAATFGAFFTRAYDFIRMAAVSRADLRLCGSHAGVSIGQDGPSQMALEDIAMMRTIAGSTVLCPADGNATVKLVLEMASLRGISYLRTAREETPFLYGPDEEFPIGGSKRVRDGDDVTIVAMGITVFEALRAAELLAKEGVLARVIDAYSIKPIDERALAAALRETKRIVVVEDHRIEGGLGDAVLAALARSGDVQGRIELLGVTAMPGSGSPAQLREWAGISAHRIVEVVQTLVHVEREAPSTGR